MKKFFSTISVFLMAFLLLLLFGWVSTSTANAQVGIPPSSPDEDEMLPVSNPMEDLFLDQFGGSTIPPAPSFCIPTTEPFSNATPVAIPSGPAVVSSTITVSGADTYLFDLNLTTSISHTYPGDLEMTLRSPQGTIVTLSTDNGGGNNEVFADTLWDDDADPGGQVPYSGTIHLVTDHFYMNQATASPLVPEEAFGAFIGENPNGEWVLTISDDLAGDGGSLNFWALQVAAQPTSPDLLAFENSNATAIPIPSGPAVISSTITVSGIDSYLFDLNLTTHIFHTFASDLDMTLRSPQGTVVTLSTDNGGGNGDVFADTYWDDDANPGGQVPYTSNDGLVTDHVYTNLVNASPLVPEEALSAFIGEDPNGDWVLTISDDKDWDGGALNSWELELVTASCDPIDPGVYELFAGTSLNAIGGSNDAHLFDVDTPGSYQPVFHRPIWGAAFDAAHNQVLYTSSGTAPENGSELWTWPVDGSAPVMLGIITDGVTGFRIDGLALSNSTLYGSRAAGLQDGIYEIDSNSLIATRVLTTTDSISGIDADPNTGVLYGVDNTLQALVEIDIAHGLITPTVSYPDATEDDLDGLAISADGKAYLIPDDNDPGLIYIYNLNTASFETPLPIPWTTSDTFSGGAFIATPEIHTSPNEISSSQPASSQITTTLTISNAGWVNLSWNIYEDNLPTGVNEPDTPSAPADDPLPNPGLALTGPAGKVTAPELETPLDVLYDQTDNADTNSIPSQAFEPTLNQYTNRAADDFVIPAGGAWTIESVYVAGAYLIGTGPVPLVNVSFYADRDGLPGATLYTYVGLTAFTENAGELTIDLSASPAVLPPGTYWMSVQADMDFNPNGQWGWTERTVQSNNASAWENPGNGFGTGCVGWNSRVSCGVGTQPDLIFQLSGTSGVPACYLPGAIPWVSVSDSMGTTTPGSSSGVEVAFDSTGLGSGVYTGTLCISSNDPLNSLITIPLTLTVNADADLAIEKSAPDSVLTSETFTYTLTVTNLGSSPALTTTVEDTLPTGLAFVSASPGCSEAAGVVTCDLGDLVPGTVVIEIVVTAPNAHDTLINTATVSSSSPDPVGGNNSDSANTEVRLPKIYLPIINR